jgi:hypothetical protein
MLPVQVISTRMCAPHTQRACSQAPRLCLGRRACALMQTNARRVMAPAAGGGSSDARRLQLAAQKSLEAVEALRRPGGPWWQDRGRGRGRSSEEGCGLDREDGVSAGPLQAEKGVVGPSLHASCVSWIARIRLHTKCYKIAINAVLRAAESEYQ